MRRSTNVSFCSTLLFWLASHFLGKFPAWCFEWTVGLTVRVSCFLQIARDNLVSVGQNIGKLTHSGKFILTIGALDILGAQAKHKVGKHFNHPKFAVLLFRLNQFQKNQLQSRHSTVAQ